MKQKQQIVHIHGGMAFNSYTQYLDVLKNDLDVDLYAGSKKERWHYNYYSFLDSNNFDVIKPDMPSKNNAKYIEWKIWFEKIIPFLNDGVVLIGHSLGGIFLAKYLSENKLSVSIKQLHLISAVFDYEDEIEQLADFKITEFPKNFYANTIDQIHIYHSTDDEVVPISESEKYYEMMPDAIFHIFADRGHFLGETFPELFENIKSVQD